MKEFCGYYSNRISYNEVEKLIKKLTGDKLLSDQKIEKIIIEKAIKVSEEEEKIVRVIKNEEGLEIPGIDTKVDIYSSVEKEILLFEDGIQVKKQKQDREKKVRYY